MNKNLFKYYIPPPLLSAYHSLFRFLEQRRMSFLYHFFRIYEDRRSSISSILVAMWENYKTDLHPKDRRMGMIAEKNVLGMSTENTRFLINELVRRYAKNGIYVEVGTFQGCSLLSAALFNSSTSCIGLDNFSEFDKNGKNEYLLKENLEKFDPGTNITFYNCDYKEWFKHKFSGQPSFKIDIYFYDGPHTYEDQYQGLQSALPFLAEKCIILVDDINLDSTAKANKYFIKKNPDFKSVFRIRTGANGSTDWWNGFEIITRGI